MSIETRLTENSYDELTYQAEAKKTVNSNLHIGSR